ncbi:MAG: CotH kinase family protein [Dysgonamonadaceae bacterium]|jgi:hypothetical protein|nr:CotH kinase family protein [Dysgonamonadaceae bacterium]
MKRLLTLVLLLLLYLSLWAQDLAGYQKLRGEILSSAPEDDYNTHAYNAFDTNKRTNYKARDKNGWVGLDLNNRYPIRKIRVYPRSDRTERMKGCIFQGANNSSFNNHTDLFTVTEIPEADKYTTYDISSNTTFRYVRCFSPNDNCNLAELEFYTDENKQPLNYSQLTNLPTVYIETNGSFDFVNKKNYVTSKVIVSENVSVEEYDAQVRGHGNSTWDFMDKKSFRIKFNEKQHFLGLKANAKSWTLIACAVDKTFLRNGLAFEISKFLGFEFTPSCAFVDVVLDGFYYGTYMASDHIDVNKNRINIDEMTPSDIQYPYITGGYHLEIDAYADMEPVHFRTHRGVPFTVKSPDSDEIVPKQKSWIENYINSMEDRLYEDITDACAEYIDMESAVKYYLLSELSGNCDSYWCVPAYKKRNDAKLYIGPVWDYDQAFLTNERVPRFVATLDTQHGVVQHWFRMIMQHPDADKIVNTLWKKATDENLLQHLLDYLDENSLLLQQSQALNYQRWNSLNRRVWFEDALFNTYDEYIDFVKKFIEDRFAWFDDAHPGKRIYFLLPSKPGNPLQTWRYLTHNPNNGNWMSVSYDDSKWESGKAPFGTEQNLQNTYWDGNVIYIRTQFYVEKSDLEKIEKTFLTLFHDEDCWIYINGQPALEREGYITYYQSFEIESNLLHEGWNTIAAKCTQTVGGQLIDAGVFATLKKVETLNSDTSVLAEYTYYVKNTILYVQAAAGTTMRLYSIEGKLLKQFISTGEKTVQIQLPDKGIYLLHTPEKTIKVVNE